MMSREEADSWRAVREGGQRGRGMIARDESGDAKMGNDGQAGMVKGGYWSKEMVRSQEHLFQEFDILHISHISVFTPLF